MWENGAIFSLFAKVELCLLSATSDSFYFLHPRSSIGCHIAFAAEGKGGFHVVNVVTMVSRFLPRRQCCQRGFEGSFLGAGNFAHRGFNGTC